MKLLFGILAVCCSVQQLGPLAAAADPVSEIVVFGDSLSDSGNVFAGSFGIWPPSPPYFDGRFSNGPIWVEQWAQMNGLPVPAPSLIGGTNYAFGGAETGLDGLSTLGTPNLGMQLDLYLDANTPRADELFVVWGGANDFLQGAETDPAVPVANLSSLLSTLAASGGMNFRVLNLPPLGQAPANRGGDLEQQLDGLSLAFNSLLSDELDRLRSELPGVTIREHDVHGAFADVVADPHAYGLTNLTDPALDEATGTVVDNPHEYLFWDGVHPTTVGHAMIAAVPEPSSLVMLVLAGVVLLIARCRRCC